MKKFVEQGCGCSRRCSRQFSKDHYLTVRAQCQELEHDYLDVALMGVLMAQTSTSETVDSTVSHRHRRESKERERQRTQFYHLGQKVK